MFTVTYCRIRPLLLGTWVSSEHCTKSALSCLLQQQRGERVLCRAAQPEKKMVHQLHQLRGRGLQRSQSGDLVLHEEMVLQVRRPRLQDQVTQAATHSQAPTAPGQETGVRGVRQGVLLSLRPEAS